MAQLARVRFLASRTLKVGKNKIMFKPNSENPLSEIQRISTRAGIRMLERRGQIQIRRSRPSQSPRTKKVRRIPQGTLKVRRQDRREYVTRIRLLRQRLAQSSHLINNRPAYWKTYRSLKSGLFNIYRTLDLQIKNLIKENA